MKKIKTFLIIPLLALFIGLLPQRVAFADDGVSPLYVNSFEEFKNFVVNSIGAIDIPEKVYSSSEYNDYMNKYPYFLICEDNTRIYFIGSYTQFSMTYQQGNQSFSSPVLKCSSNGELGTIIYYKSSKDMYYYSTTGISLDSIQGNVYPTLKLQPVKGNLRVYDTSNDFEIVEEEEDRPIELPSVGNGILITSPADGSKINKLTYNGKGYLEQNYILRVQYMPNDSIFGVNDDSQKMDIIKGISCTMEDSDFDYQIFSDSFRWIVKPSKAVDSVSTPYAIAELQINTVFKDIGKKTFTVTSGLKVSDDSVDITRDIREYTDSIDIEFVSDENYSDGSIINPDGSVGSGDNGLDFDNNLDGFPTAPGDGASIVDWIKYFGDVILWLITYPFKLLANAFVVLGGYITTMVNTLTDTSKQITGLFTFIPSDILNVTYGFISFTLLYSVVRGVLKLIRGN